MSEALPRSPELPSSQQMVGSLRSLLHRRNHLLQSNQPTRRSYELSDFSGSQMERELYGHIFVLAALIEDHCLMNGTRPNLLTPQTVGLLETTSKDATNRYRQELLASGRTTEEVCRAIQTTPPMPGYVTDQRAVLADTLVQGLAEIDSEAFFTAQEAQAVMHFNFNGFDLRG